MIQILNNVTERAFIYSNSYFNSSQKGAFVNRVLESNAMSLMIFDNESWKRITQRWFRMLSFKQI